MRKVVCPECKQRINLDLLLEIDDEVTCTRCGANWTVVSRTPLVLDWADETLKSLGAARPRRRNGGADRISMRRLAAAEEPVLHYQALRQKP